jgi:hypothetical protein
MIQLELILSIFSTQFYVKGGGERNTTSEKKRKRVTCNRPLACKGEKNSIVLLYEERNIHKNYILTGA